MLGTGWFKNLSLKLFLTSGAYSLVDSSNFLKEPWMAKLKHTIGDPNVAMVIVRCACSQDSSFEGTLS